MGRLHHITRRAIAAGIAAALASCGAPARPATPPPPTVFASPTYASGQSAPTTQTTPTATQFVAPRFSAVPPVRETYHVHLQSTQQDVALHPVTCDQAATDLPSGEVDVAECPNFVEIIAPRWELFEDTASAGLQIVYIDHAGNAHSATLVAIGDPVDNRKPSSGQFPQPSAASPTLFIEIRSDTGQQQFSGPMS